MWYSTEIIRRIIEDLIHSIDAHAVKYHPLHGKEDVDLSDDIGLSSMQLMELAAKANAFFQLFAAENPPYLLSGTKLSSWIQKIQNSCTNQLKNIGFASSGTGGQIRLHVHPLNLLLEETSFLKTLFPVPDRVISLVASHHIFGFLFTVLLPWQWKIPCLVWGEDGVSDLDLTSLIIATPFHWQYLYDSYNGQDRTLTGVSSGGPLDPILYKKMLQKGWRIMDVYGSTETGGIGFRSNPDELFQLFPHWQWVHDESGSVMLKHSTHGFCIGMMDNILLSHGSKFELAGRKDGAVQIAGVNVYPANIAEKIRDIRGVTDCYLFAKAVSGVTKLFCNIYLEPDTRETQSFCIEQMRLLLSSVEYPADINFFHS